MDLRNKKLLMMGGAAFFNHIRKYADETGFRIIAVGNNPNAVYYQQADEAYPYSTMDVDSIARLVDKEHIDGIFVGAQEMNMIPAISVAEKTGVHFYADRKQWATLSDKRKFKELCRECAVPVVPEYSKEAGIEHIQFPVLIKPVDGSGAHGMNACFGKETFFTAYQDAMNWSQKKEVIVEELIQDADEVFFQYTVQDGKCSLTSAFTKVFTASSDKSRILPIFHMYPSKYLEEYYRSVHQSITKLFEKMEIKNGVMTIQSFYRHGRFYVFEAGYRMGGAQNYIFSDYQNGTNSLRYMINYALTGNMSQDDISQRDNAFFRYPCCNYYVGLKPGTIKEMSSADDIRKLPGVLNVTVMRKEGDLIEDTNALDRICLRLHVVGKTNEELADRLVGICNSIRVISTQDEDMLMERLDYERCIAAVCNTVKTKTNKQMAGTGSKDKMPG